MSVDVFFSYAHKDEDLRDDLETHLIMLKREGLISRWYDRDITAGEDWADQIDEHLLSAQIVLLLVSVNFLASDYCWDKELTNAMERHNKREARVVPIILKPCDWTQAPFSKLQALPKNALPVTKWEDRDEAFLDIAKGLRKVIAAMDRSQSQPSSSSTDAATKASVSSLRETASTGASSAHAATGLSERKRRRLLEELNSLETEYDLLSKKLVSLRKDRIIVTDPTVQFQRDAQIEATETELEAVEQKMEVIEQKLG